ncbi:NUMOD3 domain-containing DNA-binding protein [Stenotrophomonas sp. GD03993]|uniref:NUMOD3 domain-containing DNA-binding protein n=1 Tax=unclassified Stenotrophomonas TaxID=196198 RepID=UPI00130FC3D1|nr:MULTISPECIES: NUMOD3 domain-containing DNA-binding protein [unclassified Stenotrophomonas]MDH0188195.1 NUMOD3 domain-containing DNA-binding protein [Stenotrophomonas sp. GD04051]MDH0463834.1 NUMOD3 domain-containing DNA-binding protein [Stenotrophomonas sp. GD03993]MDH0876671.1 NUMOD3 domain-containing DNA-binding protein [Stenotrophomonas sp. GD03877]MDH2155611.1 NUMOD3 domain-containing DNA-binding protein [Stenotrophomonas sp. GD03657]
MKIVSGIYRIRNLITGRCYIGSSWNVRKRFGDHQRDLQKNRHHSRFLQRSWNKHGPGSFSFELLIMCAVKDLLLYEQALIDGLKPAYNMSPTAASRKGSRASEETRKKLSESHKGKTSPRRGVRLSEETRKRISVGRRGKGGGPRSPEVIERVAVAMRASKSVLTPSLVKEGRKLRSSGASIQAIADSLGCSFAAAYDFIRGKTYSWVK